MKNVDYQAEPNPKDFVTFPTKDWKLYCLALLPTHGRFVHKTCMTGFNGSDAKYDEENFALWSKNNFHDGKKGAKKSCKRCADGKKKFYCLRRNSNLTNSSDSSQHNFTPNNSSWQAKVLWMNFQLTLIVSIIRINISQTTSERFEL